MGLKPRRVQGPWEFEHDRLHWRQRHSAARRPGEDGRLHRAIGRRDRTGLPPLADFEKSARLASHSSVGVIELMPTSDGQLYSFKYVNGIRRTRGRVAHGHRLRRVADVQTGYPLLLSELTITTALRTAAMSALAARYWRARTAASWR